VSYGPDKIRNIAVVGHQGSGKTSLVESMAYKSGLIKEKGSILAKNTISDFMKEEKLRQVSLSSAVVPIEHNGYKLNLIDLPGNDDFIFETIGITRIVKGAILVIDAYKGVESGTVKNFNMLKKRGVPILIFINKMDKEEVDFTALLGEIYRKLDGKRCVPFSYPMGHKDGFDGFVNVVELKARKYDGKSCHDDVIYDDKKQMVFALHNRLCEAVATTNDEMLEKFFSGQPLTNEEIRAGLRKSVLAGELFPILVGSAEKDIGIETLLDKLVEYLPSPLDLKPIPAVDSEGKEADVKTDVKEPSSLIIFKNTYNTYQGLISVFKVQSGIIKLGDEMICPNNGQKYKITSLFEVCGEKMTPVKEIAAGDIGATTRLENIKLSYTLSDPSRPIKFKEVKYPTPTYFNSIVPESKKDSDKLFQAVDKLMVGDPTVGLKKEETTGQILIGGLSQTHLAYNLKRLQDEYGIAFHTEPVKISYRETITQAGEAEGRFVKQTGGAGFYGIVQMRFEPASETSFESTVFGGHIDKGYFPAVEKGFREALLAGGLIKAPVINVKATLLDGKQHAVDSNEVAFKNAGLLAFRNAYESCKPIILEPYDKLKVNAPLDYLGAVLTDLTKRRARILSTEDAGDNTLDVVAIVPESEILEYTNELKSLSKGTAFFNLDFEDYEKVPDVLAETIIAQAKAQG
jgi:elongation factor G